MKKFLWSPLLPIDPAELGYTCASPFHYVSDWEGGVFTLPAGEYRLETVWSQSRPVNDGWHTCVDAVTGEPLASPPSLWRPEPGTWTVTVVVEEAHCAQGCQLFGRVGNLATRSELGAAGGPGVQSPLPTIRKVGNGAEVAKPSEGWQR
jgi:hypothetical protein